jgi:hypothetical protein
MRVCEAPLFAAPGFRVRGVVMLTAIVLGLDQPGSPLDDAARREKVVRSLASLVDACVHGLVADAIIVGQPRQGLERVADEAGCSLVEAAEARAGLADALCRARHPHVLLLAAGHAVDRGFVEEVSDLLAYGDPVRARLLRAAPESFVTRLAPSLAAPVGIIARKSAAAAAGAADLATLAKRLGAVDLRSKARRVY